MSLSGKTLKNSYIDLLQMDNSNSGVDTSAQTVTDGGGTKSCLQLSDDVVVIRPQNDNTTATLGVRASGGDSVLEVDTTNQLVRASGNVVNMQQHIFSWSHSNGMGQLAGYHYPFFATNGINFTADLSPINLSNGTDPATTLTFSNNAMSWHERFHYVTHAMSIESAIVRTTADAVTGDTVRYHIMSYDFTSGSSSVLTSGVLVAHTADITSAGYEQM